jgi:hypothetical protein
MRDINSGAASALLRWWPDCIEGDTPNPNDASGGDCATTLWGSYQHIRATLQQRQLEKGYASTQGRKSESI